jgi:hypothetical protein
LTPSFSLQYITNTLFFTFPSPSPIIKVNSKSKAIGFFILEPGSKVALMPRDPKDKAGPFKWRVLTPSRTWEFTNDSEEEMKAWVRMIARIVNPELTFGMPLSVIVARCKRRGSQSDIPVIVTTLMQFLRDNDGVNVEGIFRMSGDQNSIRQLKSRFNTEVDSSIVIHKETDVHVVTGTLKYFLRELETPLIPITCNPLLRAILCLKTPKEKVIGFRKLVEGLPKENAATLQYILKYLWQVANNNSVNLMTTQNLAVVFGPCFIRSEAGAVAFQDADMQLNCVNSMIEQYPSIFPNEDLIASSGASATAAPPASAPPGFLPPPPNFTPAAPAPASITTTFRTVPPSQGSRENGIVIGGHSAAADRSGFGLATAAAPPPTHTPPAPVTASDSSEGSDSAKLPKGTGSSSSLMGSRPPAFAPPSVPPGSPGRAGPATSEPAPLSSSSGMVHSGSNEAFSSIYDSSSSDDEMEVVSTSLADSSPLQFVTSLDDITDLEGEDGSIDVSKIFAKPLVSAASTSAGGALAGSPKARPTAGAWTPISKPPSNSISGGLAPFANTNGSTNPISPTATVTTQVNTTPATVLLPPTSTPPIEASPIDFGSAAAVAPVTAPSAVSPAPTAGASAGTAGDSEISVWLAALGEDYVPYTSILLGEGFKTVQQLSDINDDDLKELGVKMAHRKAMRSAIDKLKISS